MHQSSDLAKINRPITMTPIYTSEGQSSPLKDELDSQLSSLFTWLDIHTTSSPNPTSNVRSARGAISSRPSCCGNLILAHTDFVRQQRPLQNIGSEAECDSATLPADATAAKGLRRRRRRRRQSNVKLQRQNDVGRFGRFALQ